MTTTDPTPSSAPAVATLPGEGLQQSKMPGHWLLARLGKRVLRPGGRALTDAMLGALAITEADHVVELAPGMGATTRLVLQHRPAGYIGIERDEHAVAQVQPVLTDHRYTCRQGTALATGLPDGSATVVFGEAFLTMQSDEHKLAMAREAFRVLAPGGRYGLHELSLRPDGLDQTRQDQLRGELARAIHVGARPMTVAGWCHILEEAGFEVDFRRDAPMGLLHPRRVVHDEGYLRTAKILFNTARNATARRRVLGMRRTFQDNADHLGAITLVATKPL